MSETIIRNVAIDKKLDGFGCGLASAQSISAENYYSGIIHLVLESLHSMKYDSMDYGYVQMSKINLDLSKLFSQTVKDG